MADSEGATTMVLKVDLQCSKCSKKVKKVLCKIPQVKDQIYDVKQNTVTIKVVSCCPEMIRDKICFKCEGVIKCIEIKPPKKQPPAPAAPPPVCCRKCCVGSGQWCCCDGYYGRPAYYYICEENPVGPCSIM